MNPAIDLSVTVKHLSMDAKLRCSTPVREPGGGGVNVSRAIHRLGGDSVAIYPGGDLTGKLLEKMLDQEGIRQQKLPIERANRENVSIREKDSDQQLRLVMPGPQLDESEWRSCLEKLQEFASETAYIVASGSLPPGVPDDFYGRAAAVAGKGGARLVVDTKGKALQQAAEAGVYLLKPNMRELGQLVKRELEDESDVEQAVQEILSRSACEILVLSLGKGGAMFFEDDSVFHIPSPTVPIKSSVGAGDSMVAGMVLKLSEGHPLRRAAAFGVAAGAAAVMTEGSKLCRRSDTERLFARINGSEEDTGRQE